MSITAKSRKTSSSASSNLNSASGAPLALGASRGGGVTLARPDQKNRQAGSKAVSAGGLDAAAALVEERKPIAVESKEADLKSETLKSEAVAGAGAEAAVADAKDVAGSIDAVTSSENGVAQTEPSDSDTSLPLGVKMGLLYKSVTHIHRALLLALLVHAAFAIMMYDFVLMYVRDGQAVFPSIGEEFMVDSVGESVPAEGEQTDIPPAPGEMAVTPDPLPEATLNEPEPAPATEMSLDMPTPPTPDVPTPDVPMPDMPTPTPVADELAKEPEPEMAVEPLTPPAPMLSVDLPAPPDAQMVVPETPPEPVKEEKPPEKIQIAPVAPKPRPKPKAVAVAPPTPAPPAPPKPAPPAPKPAPAATAHAGGAPHKTGTSTAPATVGAAGQIGRQGTEAKAGTGAEGEPGGTGKVRQGTGGTARVASYAYNPSPVYPDAARKANQEGVVVLGGTVSESGSVTSVRVVRSSGFPMLDSAAMNAVSRWRLRTPAPSTFVVPVRFRLKG